MNFVTSTLFVVVLTTAIFNCGVQAVQVADPFSPKFKENDGDLYFLKLREKSDEIFQRSKSTKFSTRMERREWIVQSLKTFTASSQKNVLSVLEKFRQSQPKTSKFSYEPLWLINEILIRSPDAPLIATLLKMEEVASITLDHVYHVTPSLGHEWSEPSFLKPAADCSDPPPILDCANCTEECDPIDLWGRNYINLATAHAQNATGKGVKVGIIDTGCYRNHDEYGDRLNDEIWLDATDTNSPCPYDDNGHGTHCSGIAVGKNTGVAMDAELICCKNMNASGFTALSRDIRCVQFMVEKNVSVAGNSYYTDFVEGENLDSLKTAVDTAVNAGLVYVASSGNDSTELTVEGQYLAKFH